MTEPRRLATRAAHLPPAPVPAEVPVAPPIYRTAVFEFETMEQYSDVLGGRAAGYVYSRIDNPTSDAFAAGVAALEGAEAAQPFASGMAAVSTTLLALLESGRHVVAAAQCYGGTYSLLTNVLARFGVETTFVDIADVAAVAAAVRDETALIWAEALANPTMAVADLPGLARVGHDAGALLAVDATFATPVICRPLEHGADIVVHSATKYIGGHSDVTGGVALGSAELMGRVRAARSDLGGMLSPDDAFLLHRGLSTLPLRVHRHCANALALAAALEGHPQVESVSYPGLASHPGHLLARKLYDTDDAGGTLFGGCLMVTPRGGRAEGLAMCNALDIASVVTSLGGVHTVVSHVASTTHRQLDDAALVAAGIGPASVRVSVGLEDVRDLIDDFSQALDRVTPA